MGTYCPKELKLHVLNTSVCAFDDNKTEKIMCLSNSLVYILSSTRNDFTLLWVLVDPLNGFERYIYRCGVCFTV